MGDVAQAYRVDGGSALFKERRGGPTRLGPREGEGERDFATLPFRDDVATHPADGEQSTAVVLSFSALIRWQAKSAGELFVLAMPSR